MAGDRVEATLFRAFKEKLAAYYQEAKSENDPERARRQAWTTANSLLRQARSLVSKSIRTGYRDEGLSLPANIEEFMNEPGFKRPRMDSRWASELLFGVDSASRASTTPYMRGRKSNPVANCGG